jgi:hypothetical protein
MTMIRGERHPCVMFSRVGTPMATPKMADTMALRKITVQKPYSNPIRGELNSPIV